MGRIAKARKPKPLSKSRSAVDRQRQRLAEHIGGRLLGLRQRDYVTMREVGDACQLSNAFVCQVENGDSVPSADTLWRMARFFKVTIDYFFDGFKP